MFSLFEPTDLAIDATKMGLAQCIGSAAVLQSMIAIGFGAANDRNSSSLFKFQGYPVVGFNQWIQASGACSSGPQDIENPFNPLNMVCP